MILKVYKIGLIDIFFFFKNMWIFVFNEIQERKMMSSLDSRRRDGQSISTRDTSALPSKRVRVRRGIKEWKLSEWWPVQLLA